MESMGLRKQKRLNPKLSVFFRVFNVNVDGLFSLSTEEEKPVSMMAKNLGHKVKLVAPIAGYQAALPFRHKLAVAAKTGKPPQPACPSAEDRSHPGKDPSRPAKPRHHRWSW